MNGQKKKTLAVSTLLAAVCVYFMLAGIPLIPPSATELIEMAAAETVSPQQNVPKDTKDGDRDKKKPEPPQENVRKLPALVIPDNRVDRLDIPGISAECAVIIEAGSGQILYGKNENQKHGIASTTKVMTCLLAAEALEADPETVIEATFEMANVEGSKMGVMPGDKLGLEALIIGMLLESGNDAANVVAYGLGGSLAGFAELMNKKAAGLGMLGSSFVTPSGLDAETHYSTAYDMAILSARSLENPLIRKYAATRSEVVTVPNTGRKLYMSNHNRLLKLYDPCIGLKTGFTKKSGRCLLSAAEKNGVLLVAVTLNAPDDWNDHMKLYEACFSEIEILEDVQENVFDVPVVGSFAEEIRVAPDTHQVLAKYRASKFKLKKCVDLPNFLYAPILRKHAAGKVSYCAGDRLVAEYALYPQQDAYLSFVPKSAPNTGPSFLDDILLFFKRILYGT